ncbi:hypothetical protein [Thalassobellus citreus]|uniref:hypothetical protein n=1 Tax=Thalassobellus citreus TaxID=3367752 RepID=UPI00378ADC99
MNAIRSKATNTINEKYTQRVLKQEASNIFSAQERVLNRFNPKFKKTILEKRKFTVTGTALVVEHSIMQRVIDMKNIRGRKQKAIPNHNTIIYGHFNNIINQLQFGLTDDVRNLIAQEHKIVL